MEKVELEERARALRAEGLSFEAIGRRLRVARSTAYYLVNPQQKTERLVSAPLSPHYRAQLRGRAAANGTTITTELEQVLTGRAPALEAAEAVA